MAIEVSTNFIFQFSDLGTDGTTLQLTGSGLDGGDASKVMIGKNECTISSQTANQINCNVGQAPRGPTIVSIASILSMTTTEIAPSIVGWICISASEKALCSARVASISLFLLIFYVHIIYLLTTLRASHSYELNIKRSSLSTKDLYQPIFYYSVLSDNSF